MAEFRRGYMHYDLVNFFTVSQGRVTPKKLALKWSETGDVGEIDAISKDGVNYCCDYWYQKDPERGTVQFRLFAAKSGAVILLGKWFCGNDSGPWMFLLEE